MTTVHAGTDDLNIRPDIQSKLLTMSDEVENPACCQERKPINDMADAMHSVKCLPTKY